MKKLFCILIVLNLIALVCTVNWYIKSNFQDEPLVAVITCIISLLGLLFASHKSKSIKLEGRKNFTYQKNPNSSANIKGDENITIQ